MADTCKVINLYGKKSSPEPIQHIINFPGGAIEVCRRDNGEYWAHIEVYKGQIIDGTSMESCEGVVVDSRIDYYEGDNTKINNHGSISQVAVRIAPK